MWDKIKQFFLGSETIFLARLQVFIGLVLAVVLATDPQMFTAYIPTKWIPLFLFGGGVLTEYARRRRANLRQERGTPDDEIRGV